MIMYILFVVYVLNIVFSAWFVCPALYAWLMNVTWFVAEYVLCPAITRGADIKGAPVCHSVATNN